MIFVILILVKARDCYFTDESSLAFYDKYTFSNCRSNKNTKAENIDNFKLSQKLLTILPGERLLIQILDTHP